MDFQNNETNVFGYLYSRARLVQKAHDNRTKRQVYFGAKNVEIYAQFFFNHMHFHELVEDLSYAWTSGVFLGKNKL